MLLAIVVQLRLGKLGGDGSAVLPTVHRSKIYAQLFGKVRLTQSQIVSYRLYQLLHNKPPCNITSIIVYIIANVICSVNGFCVKVSICY